MKTKCVSITMRITVLLNCGKHVQGIVMLGMGYFVFLYPSLSSKLTDLLKFIYFVPSIRILYSKNEYWLQNWKKECSTNLLLMCSSFAWLDGSERKVVITSVYTIIATEISKLKFFRFIFLHILNRKGQHQKLKW